jgi:hypothetical protein
MVRILFIPSFETEVFQYTPDTTSINIKFGRRCDFVMQPDSFYTMKNVLQSLAADIEQEG